MREYRNGGRRSRKKKRVHPYKEKWFNISMIIQGAVILCFLTAAFFYIPSSLRKGRGAGNVEVQSSVKEMIEETTPPETETKAPERVVRDIKIDDISIMGLTKEETREKLLNTYTWNIQLKYGEKVEPIENPLPQRVKELVEKIYSENENKGNGVYRLDLSDIEGVIRTQIEKAAAKWDKAPLNGQLTGWDKENKRWIYSEGENGAEINQEKAVQDIMNAVKNKKFEEIILVDHSKKAPELSAAGAKKEYKVIGTFSTVATSNQNRNNNILLAINALNGLVIFPGEEFSFNKTTGNRTIERGYKPAGAYRNGEFVEEPGGGVCQISSTLYNAIIFSGIKTTERNPHSFEPSYVTPGEDSMVSYDGYSGPDLRFVNKQNTSVAIRAVFEDKKLTVSIIGMPILEDGVKVSMRSEKTKDYDPPAPKYEEDQTLQPGQEVETTEGVKGSTWKTYLVTSKDGKVIKEDYFHTSTYRGKAGVVKRNTSGIVIPAETEAPHTTEPPVESAGAAETVSPDESAAETIPESQAPEHSDSNGTQNPLPTPTETKKKPVGPGIAANETE